MMECCEETRREATEEILDKLSPPSFADHVLCREGDGRWLCARPGTGMYHFRLISAPGAIIVYGDCTDGIVRSSYRDLIPWLRGAAGSPDYLLSKTGLPRDCFYRGDAKQWLKEYAAEGAEEEQEENSKSAATVIEMMNHPSASYYEFQSACHSEGICDVPDFCWYDSSALWLVAELRTFIRLLDVPGLDE